MANWFLCRTLSGWLTLIFFAAVCFAFLPAVAPFLLAALLAAAFLTSIGLAWSAFCRSLSLDWLVAALFLLLILPFSPLLLLTVDWEDFLRRRPWSGG